MKKVIGLGCLIAGTVCAQVQDEGWRFIVSPTAVEKQSDGAVEIHYDLSGIPLETSLNSVIWYKCKVFSEGANPSLAVWSVDANGKKNERITEVTIRPNLHGPLAFPVSRYVRKHFKDGALSFRIESRAVPGFSQKVDFQGRPNLCIVKAQAPDYDLRDLLAPVWKGSRMVNETILPTSYDGKPAKANLAFVPSRIVGMKDYALDKTYVEGKDYTVFGRTIRLTKNSSIRFLNYQDLYHDNPDAKPGVMKAIEGGFLTFGEGSFFNDHQLAVTYEHRDPWMGPIPKPANQHLPKTFRALENGKSFKLVVFGDSISVGASSSGKCVRAPWMPRWADLVVDELERAYGSEIGYINPSLGGMRSDWGRDAVDGLVAFEKPDLVILGFGMNDAGCPFSTEQFVANTKAIMASVHAQNPKAEFILLMSFQNNPKWRPLKPMIGYLEALKKMEGPGVAVVDMWSMHGYLLEHKTYWDMTGNHVNHPNDFMVRVYAQSLLATLGVQ